MIAVKLDRLLVDRKLTLTELARRVGISVPNLSLLKTGKVKEIRLALLEALCRELSCAPGDLLAYAPGAPAALTTRAASAGLDFID
jgi:putative transcriptional regulator